MRTGSAFRWGSGVALRITGGLSPRLAAILYMYTSIYIHIYLYSSIYLYLYLFLYLHI